MRTKSKNEKVDETVFVALLDILGFKDLVSYNSHQELLQIYLKLDALLHVAHDLATRGDEALSKPNINNEDEIGYNKVQSLIISDSILLWSIDSSVESFEEIVDFVRLLLFLGF